MFEVKTFQNGSHAKIAKGEFSTVKQAIFACLIVFCGFGDDGCNVFRGYVISGMSMSRQINPSRLRVQTGLFSIYFDLEWLIDLMR